MPLSCKGRYRGSEPSRGDVDDVLGKYELRSLNGANVIRYNFSLPTGVYAKDVQPVIYINKCCIYTVI